MIKAEVISKINNKEDEMRVCQDSVFDIFCLLFYDLSSHSI